MASAQGSHHAMPMSQVQLQQQQQQANLASEQAKRRSRKPTDKTMPEGVEEVVIGDGVRRYKDLRDLERRLDATMTRKRLDIVDSVGRSPKVKWQPGLWGHGAMGRVCNGALLPREAERRKDRADCGRFSASW